MCHHASCVASCIIYCIVYHMLYHVSYVSSIRFYVYNASCIMLHESGLIKHTRDKLYYHANCICDGCLQIVALCTIHEFANIVGTLHEWHSIRLCLLQTATWSATAWSENKLEIRGKMFEYRMGLSRPMWHLMLKIEIISLGIKSRTNQSINVIEFLGCVMNCIKPRVFL